MSRVTRSVVYCFAAALALCAGGCFHTTLVFDTTAVVPTEPVEAPSEPGHHEVRWFVAGAPLGGSPMSLEGICEHGIQRIEQVMTPAGAGVFAASLTFASSRDLKVYCTSAEIPTPAIDSVPAEQDDPFLEDDEPAPWEDPSRSADDD